MSESPRDRFRKITGGGGRSQPAPPSQEGAGAREQPPPAAPRRPPPSPRPSESQLFPVPAAISPAAASRAPSPATPPASPAVPTETATRRPPAPDATLRKPDNAPPDNLPPALAEPTAATRLAAAQDAQLFLQQLRVKMARLAEEFAQGKLNSKQFHEIYAHYQKQRNVIEMSLYDMSGSETWRDSIVPGQTGMLRQRHAGKVLSYAIYDNASSMPLASVGDFSVDTALLVPMLSSFRSATAEIFGAGLRSTEIEGGRWLCFVPGRYTTLFVIFSIEPARLQLTLIEDLHRDFEVANRYLLEHGEGEEAARQFTRLWALDKVVI